MPSILQQKSKRETVNILAIDAITVLTREEGSSARLSVGKGYIKGACIGCLEPRCMYFDKTELNSSVISDFPADPDYDVCPTHSLVWNEELEIPQIIQKYCIACGLCAMRCPFGAIYFDKGFQIHTDQAYIVKKPLSNETKIKQSEYISSARKAVVNGNLLDDIFSHIDDVYQKIASVSTDAQFPNRLARNLLIAGGNNCSIRRRGDVNLRMDAIFNNGCKYSGVAEVEFTQDSLESPRAILDDIAVLSARYGINKKTIKPLIVYFKLPNSRTGHWQVVKDIKNVLGIEIQTLTIGMLLAILWSGHVLDLSKEDFYIDIDNRSLLEKLVLYYDINASIETLALSAFEPEK